MQEPNRTKRILGGLALVILLLGIGFAVTSALIYNWGSTPEEVAATYPGDDIYPQPQIIWTHAITIQAAPEQIWPWIVQIGDTRAAFYSHTFIENLIARQDLYNNADRIVAEWQNPPLGQGMIVDYMTIKEIQSGKWLLAETHIPLPGFGMSWLWQLNPESEGATRLIVRLRIGIPAEMNNFLVRGFIHVGGFVMEQGMLQGIQDRVEGRIPPVYFEPAEILLWLVALIAGVYSAVRFVKVQRWIFPLVAVIDAVIVLFILTFVQPDLWIRLVLDVFLIAELWWFQRLEPKRVASDSPMTTPELFP